VADFVDEDRLLKKATEIFGVETLEMKFGKWRKKYARTSCRVRRETAVRKTLYFITWITRLLTSRSRLNVTSFYVLCKIVQMSLQESGVLKGLPFVLFPIVLCARTTIPRGSATNRKSISNMLRGRTHTVVHIVYCVLSCILYNVMCVCVCVCVVHRTV